ncbi:MAP kinase kinase (MEK), partial [Coemansia sp. RSA 2703]
MVFTKPVRKKRNFKSLTLAVPEGEAAAAPGGSAAGGAATATGEIGGKVRPPPLLSNKSAPIDLQLNGGNFPEAVCPLELGVELRLDLREEDLEIGKPMGEGAGGTVVKAMHKPTATPMALKFIRADFSIRQQILKELQILHECNSPYIVSFYGAYPKDNGVQVCLEFMDLKSFDWIYRKNGPIPVPVIGKVTYSVLQGLKYLYEDLRVMHRDIKPSNILFNSQGFIKLCDFGISKEM